MKKILFSLTALAVLSLGACNNAASKIKADEDNGSSAAETTPVTNKITNQEMLQQQVDANKVKQQAQVDPDIAAEFAFTQESHDFGEIEEGTIAKHDFTFTNTSDNPLVITNAQGSCGCTVPEWPREPIAPGETGTIHVEFNSTNRVGNQTKQVTLTANTIPSSKILRISAQVNKKPGADAAAE